MIYYLGILACQVLLTALGVRAKYLSIEQLFHTPGHTAALFNPEALSKLEIIDHEPMDLPENFDAREKWPQCDSIHDLYDQTKGVYCGSCWAISSATAASDRICIHKNESIRLSVQDFECMAPNKVCEGNEPLDALFFYVKEGLVTRECKPYNPIRLYYEGCSKICVNSKDYDSDKHIGSGLKRIAPIDHAIKAEIYKNGPIVGGHIVFEDYLTYRNGVYHHRFGKNISSHAIRIIGYGVEDGDAYWLVANSLGSNWGDNNGVGKIRRFDPDLELEDNLVAGFP